MDATMNHDLQLLVGYADRGWKILPIHGVKADGVCKCSKGKDCPSPGKHPIHRDWASAASNDAEQVAEWFERYPGCNWGLKLGPDSGVVDIEYDTAEGEATANEIFGEFYTPTGQSKRSKHRFVKWSKEFPDKQKLEIRGLEIRIGGGAKSTQSVIPPSRHHTGTNYAWLEGLSPDDVDVAEAPDALLSLIYNQGVEADHKVKEQFPPSKARKIHDEGKVKEGTRNDKLYLFACREAALARSLDDPQAQGDLLDKVLGQNLLHCDPPLDRGEVESIYRSAIGYVRRQAAGRAHETARQFTIHGLSYDEGVWGPGDWRLTIINSDPVTYRVHVPAWRGLTPDGSGNITLTADEYDEPGKVARAVRLATRSIILNDRPGLWPTIWNGKAAKQGQPSVRGIKAQLTDAFDEEDPPPTAKRHVIVAEYLLEKLSTAKVADDPDLKVQATRRTNGEVWFRWKHIWQDGLMTQHVVKGEPENLQRLLGLTPADFRYWPHRGDGRIRFCVLDPKHVAALHAMTHGHEAGGENG